uniref:Uncharacterized protein n=1 Tax=Trichogramma kaykai TaxID=54128 RepID=A0ABD2WNV6_9HYME
MGARKRSPDIFSRALPPNKNVDEQSTEPWCRNLVNPEEIDWLLTENIKTLKKLNVSEVDRIIKFVIDVGYEDKSNVGTGRPEASTASA